MVGFMVVHLIGNLQVFFGGGSPGDPAQIDKFATALHANESFVLAARLILLAAVIAHIVTSVKLARANRAARPERYAYKKPVEPKSYAARTMIMSGPIIGAFLTFHILHLTTRTITPNYTHDGHHLYRAIIDSFSQWWLAVIYMVAMLLISLHLRHGVWSMLQTLGANNPKTNRVHKFIGTAFSVVICGGFFIIPLAVLLGIVE